MTDEDELFAALAEVFAGTDTTQVTDVTTLSGAELVERYNAVERTLSEMHQLHRPQSREAREHHSRRSAYLLELRRRKLL
jgi:hypothetical protein